MFCVLPQKKLRHAPYVRSLVMYRLVMRGGLYHYNFHAINISASLRDSGRPSHLYSDGCARLILGV